MPRLKEFLKSIYGKCILLTAAVALFCAGIYFSIQSQPNVLDNVDYAWAVVVILVLTPLNLVLSSFEFKASVALLKGRVEFVDAFKTTVVASAANILPIPGSVMVRLVKLKSLGVSYKEGSIVTIMQIAFWFSVTFFYGGLWLTFINDNWMSYAVTSVGLASLIASFILSAWRYNNSRIIYWMSFLRLLLIVSDAFALYVCFKALGIGVGFSETSVLSVSSFLGSTVSFVPGGLGIREFFAALIGEIINLNVASVYLAASLYRILGLLVVLPVGLYFGYRERMFFKPAT
ncbi:lysylphosphatidylglycerol synthase domain-containing protein [Kordiimonas lacus]|jgi:hypothetical protein|uniref:lysylphosphatidylglycerol synthase domain-containing protein n=1 Tax=Kordiimonas lacus TaxID=637679 RepID=UPI002FD9D198